ncbi:hypothetical protein [Alloprevotella tannerae]|uniref:DUF4625 domain-containing protein n=1 Tax=Alloprevotella tannerae TaxID=76122 RepID=A0A929RYY5_9BACT|nr:hypothetical protein [Alloprevotella tannerae]MBF0970846.1 hypothetical protein [Alloprevotella tannerae]
MKKFYNSILPAVLFLCGLSLSLTACSHNGGEDMPEEPQKSGDTILATISQATGTHIGQDVNGLKIGDSIYYNLTIDDPKGSKSATYTLDLDGVGSTKNHRRFNKDFTLHISKIADDGSTNDWHQITEFPYTLPSKGRYRLMYVAKSDGTFIHEFKLQRKINNKPNSKVTNFSVVFNVLDVDLVYNLDISQVGNICYNVWYSLGISIKGGDFATDKLLEKSNGSSYAYRLIYDGKEYSSSFESGSKQVFVKYGQDYVYDIGPYINDKYVSELVITIKPSNGAPPTYFQYKNLKMRKVVNWRRV